MRYDRKKTVFTSILTSILTFVIMAVVSLMYIGTKSQTLPKNQTAQQTKINTPVPQQLAAQVPTVINTPATSVASRSVQSVVGIAVLKPDGDSIFKTQQGSNWGVGSGVIVDSNGYILTNNHVAGGETKQIIVTLAGGDSVNGVTLWSDPVLDLAVVKINVTGLPAAKIGDAKSLKIGEPAIAIGNPLGLQLQRTVTSGIISALNRTVQVETENGTNFMEDLIQTDASINPGNSGGPLMNSKGEVVGINTIKVSAAEGIGFAIPINIAKPVINSFVNNGRFDEPYLGLFAYDREVIPYINPNLNVDSGVYVSKIDSGSPAAASGIRIGDIIEKVDGNAVHTMADLRALIYNKVPGDTIRIDAVTNGKTKVVDVKLAKKIRQNSVTR